MTKRGKVFRVPVEGFDVGAVPVPVFHLNKFGRCSDVQVGQDERIPVDVIDLPFQGQRLLRLVDGPELPGARVGRHQLDRDPGPPGDTQTPASAGHLPGR